MGIDNPARQALLENLGAAMSLISERCYYAGWLGGTEYLVPELCRRAVERGKALKWGHGQVAPLEAKELLTMADRLGCWADLDKAGVGYVEFQPFPLPAEYCEQAERELLPIPSSGAG